MGATMDPVGIVGVGVMGQTAGRKLVESGRRALACDAAPSAQEKARQVGMEIVTGPAEVASRCPVVLMFLPGPPQVVECVGGPEGLLAGAAPGTIIVDLSTVDPGTTCRMAALARARGVGYLDAPILGRPVSVGKWALPVGGRAEDLEACRPILAVVAAKIMHIGESGSGNKIKLLNQMMFSAINAMTAEMMAVAEKVGVAPKLLYDTVTASQAGTVSNLFLELGKNISEEKYDQPTFTVALLCKDLRLAIEMAKAHGAPPLLAGTIQFINEAADAQGLGAKDTAAMWKAYQSFWGSRR